MIMQGDYTESESYAREYVATSLKLLMYWINNRTMSNDTIYNTCI